MTPLPTSIAAMNRTPADIGGDSALSGVSVSAANTNVRRQPSRARLYGGMWWVQLSQGERTAPRHWDGATIVRRSTRFQSENSDRLRTKRP